MTRRHWNDLPATVQRAVQEYTGHIERVEPVAAGSTADVAATIHTPAVTQFRKGVRVPSAKAWMYRNEARVNNALPHSIVPDIRWTVEKDGWLLLGFDYADGRHADVTVGSPDLPRIAATLGSLPTALTPCPIEPIQPATARWAGRVAPEHLDGSTLLHTDVTPRNFLVGERIAVVDWSTPCRGAAWIDTALMVIRLIRAGHTPQQAERWATTVPLWATASPAALDAFVPAMAALYGQRHEKAPAVHRRELAAAASLWTAWRSTRETGDQRCRSLRQ